MTIIIYNKEKFNETYAEIYNIYFSKDLSNVYSNKKNIKNIHIFYTLHTLLVFFCIQ